MLKLYLISALRKAKKFERIYGKELKSVVISGRLEPNIISIKVDRNSGVITLWSLDSTTVNRATNYCYFV